MDAIGQQYWPDPTSCPAAARSQSADVTGPFSGRNRKKSDHLVDVIGRREPFTGRYRDGEPFGGRDRENDDRAEDATVGSKPFVRERENGRNVQRFRGGLVFKAHRLCVSLNARLESNKEEEEEWERTWGSGSSKRMRSVSFFS